MGQANPETTDTRESAVMMEATPRRRRRTRRRTRSATARKRLRVLYFTLASAWGFTAGTVAVLICYRSTGKPWRIETASLGLLAGAGLLAVIGGVVAALAYHDASKRLG